MQGIQSDQGAFPWRGFMIDPCRHFFPVEELHRLVDGMAVLKLNILHIHLNDDQGWRFESKKWPKLTEIGSYRSGSLIGRPGSTKDNNLHPESYVDKFDDKPVSGFYTQEQLRKLSSYASSKGVTVVPEIDMPGHMRAARAAYPELGYNGRVIEVGKSWGVYPEVLRVDEKGMKFAQDIVDELCDVFDSHYINIGGDECPKVEWQASPTARKQLEDIGGGEDMEELQRWFTGQMATYLSKKGRSVVGWDEIIDGGVPEGDPIVVAWRGWTNAAKRSTDLGVKTIQAPGLLYFDHAQGPEESEPLSIGRGSDLEQVYSFDPYEGIDPKNKHLIKGMQAQIWTEYVADIDHLWYMVFPRLVAMADVAYLGDKRPSYKDFLQGLPARLEELKKLGIGHHPLS